MSQSFLTTQIGTLIANAGLTETVNVSAPSTTTLTPDGTGIAAGESGATIASTVSPTPSWTTWLVIGALGWFGYQWLKGGS